ncbi:PAS domain S-box protein [Haloarcula salina]|nr:PAS domain S-box protein [Haloarcula salina]
MRSQVRVLHVDDDPDLTAVVAQFLEREDDRFSVETAANATDGLARLEDGDIDCIVSDYDMPGTNGIDFLEAVREFDSDLPFILYTGKGSEEIASDAISSGVTDYLQKSGGTDQYTVLANRIANAVEAYRATRDLERKSRQDEAIATLSRDALEGLALPSLFERAVGLIADRLDTEYAAALRSVAEDDRLSPVAATGWDRPVTDRETVDAGPRTQAGYTLSVSEPVVVEDLSGDDRFRESTLLTDSGVVSGISVVVGSRDDPWGVLGTYATTGRSFSDDDVRFVQSVANVLGTAIQRHRSEQRRRESERRFREIAEVSPDTIFRLDTDGVFTYVSPVVESLLGFTREELLGENFQQYVEADTLATAFDGFSRVRDGETVRELELALVDADGSRVDVEVSASPVRHDGAIVFVQGLVRDISDRKERERELRRYREYTDCVLDGIDDLLFVHDADGDLQRWNESFAAVTGYDDATLATMNGVDFVPETHREATAAAITQVFETGHARHQAPLLTSDGSEIPYEFVANRVTHPDGTVLLVGIGRDITDRKERERERRALEARYRTLVENLPDMGVFLFDRDLRYTLAAGSELAAVGLTSDDFEGMTAQDLFPDDLAEETEHYYREALAGNEGVFEQAYQGERYRVQTVPVRDDEGEVISGLAVSENVTERRARQRELERQNEQLREFASVVSHDLRNPLNVARGRLELARAESDSEHLDDIGTALDRSHALIDDLLALARSGDAVSDTEPVALVDLVEQCWQNVPTAASTLVVETDQTILADRARLEQLFENLLRNAVEHGPAPLSSQAQGDAVERGPPTSPPSSESDDGEERAVTVTVGSLADGFYVEDTGPGVPPADREKVFEAGYSTATDGTGFGLRIVRQIAHAHGWDVSVTDGASGGARFEVRGVETAP